MFEQCKIMINYCLTLGYTGLIIISTVKPYKKLPRWQKKTNDCIPYDYSSRNSTFIES